MKQYSLSIQSNGRGIIALDTEINHLLQESGYSQGLCHLFIHHTSASLIITENADPNVHHDLENYFSRLVVDGDPSFLHDQEGPDDMSAHIRSVLTQTEVNMPFRNARLAMGTWQSVFLWEHRSHPHRRNMTLTLQESNSS